MTLSELKYIVAVAKYRHFRKASESCYVSQPTLSIAIKKLEDELGINLFERHRNDILLTPIGEKIVTLADSILQQAEHIKQLAKEEQGDHSGELRIGAIYTIGPYLLPKLIPVFHRQFPHIPLIVEENYTKQLMQKLHQGELDFVILSLPYEDPAIETLVLYEEPFVLALPPEHPLSKNKEIKIIDLKNQTFLLLGAGHCFRDQVVDTFPNLAGLQFERDQMQRTLEGSSLETIRFMVASGAGITILPCSSINGHEELLAIRKIESPTPSRQVALAWRKSFPRQQVLNHFIEAIQSIKIPCTMTITNPLTDVKT